MKTISKFVILATGILVSSCNESEDVVTLDCDEPKVGVEEFANNNSYGLTDYEAKLMPVLFNPKKSIEKKDIISYFAEQSLSQRPSTTRALGNEPVIIPITKNSFYEDKIAASIYSAMPDTIAYFVSSGDGYSILSADLRFGNEILCEIHDGEIPDLDMITDENTAYILDNVARYMLNSFTTYQRQEAELTSNIFEKIESSLEVPGNTTGTRAVQPPHVVSSTLINTVSTNWVTSKRIESLVPVAWDQGAPYNNEASFHCGETVKAGCVAVAAAHILAYWQWPSQIGNMTIHWTPLCETLYVSPDESQKSLEVSHIMWTIGDAIDMDYGQNGSGAQTEDARDWLLSIGYQGGAERSYNYNDVVSSLDNGSPVLARGDKYFEYITIMGQPVGYTHGGHSWVIDGCLKRYRVLQDLYEATYSNGTVGYYTVNRTQNDNYQYCKWGWRRGARNGWFPEGCFDSNQTFGPFNASDDCYTEDRSSFYEDTPNPGTPSRDNDIDGTEGNYQYNKKIYINLRPSSL